MSKPDIEIAREASKLPIATVAQRLGIGGDWCLGATAEDAFLSGRALSQQVLGRS